MKFFAKIKNLFHKPQTIDSAVITVKPDKSSGKVYTEKDVYQFAVGDLVRVITGKLDNTADGVVKAVHGKGLLVEFWSLNNKPTREFFEWGNVVLH